jgi:signal peptidase II
MKSIFKIFVSLTLILCNISCDQISKNKVRNEISANETINLISDNFILMKVENTGAALSLGSNLSPIMKMIFLQLLPIGVLILMFIHIIRNKNISKEKLIAISFIIGGGIANIYDRILFESVTDFMYMKIGFLHTGIFNMADVSVSVGVLILLYEYGMIQLIQRKQKVSM